MLRRHPRVLALGIVAALALAVVVGGLAQGPRTMTATGVVVAVDAVSLTDVRTFTLRVAGGKTTTFSLASLQSGVEFPPGHLGEHMALGTPIVVTYRVENGIPSAITIGDAPSPGPT